VAHGIVLWQTSSSTMSYEIRLTLLFQGGNVLTVSFELDGQKFTALNGGPQCSELSAS
jgi:predicted 3-demethylubiquinone-9 3-methyltransferase (glyoxalase superfamily)